MLELNPAEAAAYGGLGRAASALGRHQEAIEYFTRALELQPRATIIHYQLALAYRRLGDMEAARAHLEQRGDKEIAYADPLLDAIEPLKTENIADVVLEMASNPEEHDDRSLALFAAGLPRRFTTGRWTDSPDGRNDDARAGGVLTKRRRIQLVIGWWAPASTSQLQAFASGRATSARRAARSMRPLP